MLGAMRPIYPVLLLLCHSTAVSLAQPAVDPLTTLRPPSHQPLPDVASNDWTRQRLDYFVLAKLEAEVLRPSPAANRPVWLRRVCFDLVGLSSRRCYRWTKSNISYQIGFSGGGGGHIPTYIRDDFYEFSFFPDGTYERLV